MVQWPGWKLLSVGDFVKSRWWSRVFVIRLGRVNPDSCQRWAIEVAKLNSNCVTRVSHSMVTSQILPRLSFVSELRDMAWLLFA